MPAPGNLNCTAAIEQRESIVGDSKGNQRSETAKRHRSGRKAMHDAVQNLFDMACAEVVDSHLDG